MFENTTEKVRKKEAKKEGKSFEARLAHRNTKKNRLKLLFDLMWKIFAVATQLAKVINAKDNDDDRYVVGDT